MIAPTTITARAFQDEATADFTKAIELKPDNGLAYFDRAIFYGRNGLQDQAIADFTKAIALKTKPNPNSYVRLSPNFYIYGSYNGRAWAYHMKGGGRQSLRAPTRRWRWPRRMKAVLKPGRRFMRSSAGATRRSPITCGAEAQFERQGRAGRPETPQRSANSARRVPHGGADQ